MSANSVVRAWIDEAVKAEAAVVLKAMGLSLSDAVRLMLISLSVAGIRSISSTLPAEAYRWP